MSSFTRRIQRQVSESNVRQKNLVTGALERRPPRHIYFGGRGRKLGVHNPKDCALLARIDRETRREVAEARVRYARNNPARLRAIEKIRRVTLAHGHLFEEAK